MKHKCLLIDFISYSQNAFFAPKSMIMRNAPPNKETQRDASGQVVVTPIRVVECQQAMQWRNEASCTDVYFWEALFLPGIYLLAKLEDITIFLLYNQFSISVDLREVITKQNGNF